MTSSNLFLKSLIGAALLALAGCSNTSSGTDKSATAKQQTQTAALESADAEANETKKSGEQEFANVIRKEGSVSNRGGYIKILVNGTPITNYEIQRRAKFLKVRRVSGNRTKVAEKELIEQALKLNEARRLRTLATDEQVNTAYSNFASGNKITTARLSQEMRKLGIGENHFKDYIRTQISWNRSIQRFSQAKLGNSQASERDIITGLRKSGEAKPELTEYFFKRIIFVVPSARRSASVLATRKREAQSLRQRFQNCKEIETTIASLKDVSFSNERRIFEPQIPEQWKKPVANADAKGTTSPIETKNGVEFMIICDKRQVNDDRAAVVANQAKEFSDLNTKSSELDKEFLAQLRKNATIVYQ